MKVRRITIHSEGGQSPSNIAEDQLCEEYVDSVFKWKLDIT